MLKDVGKRLSASFISARNHMEKMGSETEYCILDICQFLLMRLIYGGKRWTKNHKSEDLKCNRIGPITILRVMDILLFIAAKILNYQMQEPLIS